MPSLVNSEFRSQHRYIESSIDLLIDTLSTPEIAEKLGSLGLRLLAKVEDYYVPNIVHGEIQLPVSRLDSDSLALTALRPSSKVRLDPKFAFFTPRRRQTALNIARQLELGGDDIEDWFDRRQAAIYKREINYPENKRSIRGMTAQQAQLATRMKLSADDKANATGFVDFQPRPVLLLRKEWRPFSPPTFGHELTHVLQGDARPLLYTDGSPENDIHDGLKRELEAYRVGAVISGAIVQAGGRIKAADVQGMEIDEARQRIVGNSYDPNQELIDTLLTMRVVDYLLLRPSIPSTDERVIQ